MKILYIYPIEEGYNNRNNLSSSRFLHIERLKKKGFNVVPFGMSSSPRFTFNQIGRLWILSDRKLFAL